MDAVLYAAANTAEDFPGGITGMAQAIGKNKFSLAHELSETGTAKLGLRDALKMVKRSRDLRIVNAVCDECGGIFVPLPESLTVDGNRTMQDLAAMAKEFGDAVQVIAAAVADSSVNANELAAARREWSELVAVGQRLMAGLEAIYEDSKPTHLRAA